MFRNNKKTETSTFKHPAIVDIAVNHEETLINFKKKQNQKNSKRKDHNTQNGKKNERQPEDNTKAEQSEEAAAEAEDSPKKLPDSLCAVAQYSFNQNYIVLCFYTPKFDWSLVYINGLYNFHKTNISQDSFVETTGNDYVHNFNLGRNAKSKTFKLSLENIDRHILMKKFSVEIQYMFYEDIDKQLYYSKYHFDVPFFQQETRLHFKFLGHFHADRRLTTLFNNNFKTYPCLSDPEMELLEELDRYQRRSLSDPYFGGSTASQMIRFALNIEDLESQNELKEFTLTNVELHGLMDNYFFNADQNMIPTNHEEMSLCLVPMHKYSEGKINFEDDCIFAQVNRIEHNQIHFEKKFTKRREDNVVRTVDRKTRYSVRWVPNRISYRATLSALDSIRQHALHHFFDDFEYEPELSRRDNGVKIQNFEWCNQQITTNDEQKIAITNIVNCTAYPFPYVVHGPPGTGKTSLIVESIAQILKAKPKARIIVTAQSNSACDEVGVRLLKYISRSKIYRFYSPSLLNPNSGETARELREISNLRNRRNEHLTKEEFYHFNVVIVTLMTCSRLVQLDAEGMNRHFDYIFVDECAAANEAEAFVPIMGLGADFQEITTNLVLLGDHKQLGPVISSDIAARLGLGVSLMERIMSKRRYRVDENGTHDKNYVTQLLDNFRSHPAILQFSNVLFYNSKLRAKLQEPEKSFGTRWNLLVNRKFPVLFHCNKSPSQVARGGTSSFNDGEVALVRFYVDSLLKVGVGGQAVTQEDIGVVSPYKAQLNKLRQELNHVRNVEIGTAEYYQGREKKIIIISTVKSRNNVGFLKSEKRLNVCITRAKSLLILVGNADTLQQNSLWNSFMHFCKANDGCCGEEFTLTKLTEEEQKVLDALNSVFSQLSVDPTVETQQAIDKDKALKAIEDRMEKLEKLMQRL